MTIKLEDIPPELSQALQRKAAAQGKSVPEVVLEELTKSMGVTGANGKKRDLSKFIGSWVEDPAFDEAMKDFEQIDPDLWK